jgi:hypothetical protein
MLMIVSAVAETTATPAEEVGTEAAGENCHFHAGIEYVVIDSSIWKHVNKMVDTVWVKVQTKKSAARR